MAFTNVAKSSDPPYTNVAKSGLPFYILTDASDYVLVGSAEDEVLVYDAGTVFTNQTKS